MLSRACSNSSGSPASSVFAQVLVAAAEAEAQAAEEAEAEAAAEVTLPPHSTRSTQTKSAPCVFLAAHLAISAQEFHQVIPRDVPGVVHVQLVEGLRQSLVRHLLTVRLKSRREELCVM